jgi:hypothetical protein
VSVSQLVRTAVAISVSTACTACCS